MQISLASHHFPALKPTMAPSDLLNPISIHLEPAQSAPILPLSSSPRSHPSRLIGHSSSYINPSASLGLFAFCLSPHCPWNTSATQEELLQLLRFFILFFQVSTSLLSPNPSSAIHLLYDFEQVASLICALEFSFSRL